MTQKTIDTAKKWFITILVLLTAALLLLPTSYSAHYFILIWAIAALAALYRSKKIEDKKITRQQKTVLIAVGLMSVLLSYASIPLGIGKTPYSLDDFTLLIAGASLLIFTLLEYNQLILPALIPITVVLGYQILGSSPSELSQPLIKPTTDLIVLVLTAIGLNPKADGNIISYLTRNGNIMRLSIVSDCTGVWSLIAYSLSVAAILILFKKITPKGRKMMAFGFLGTYLVNILRVTLIFIAGYYSGEVAAIQTAHTHIGWIVFLIWMLIFWYSFFRMHVFEKESEDATGPRKQ